MLHNKGIKKLDELKDFFIHDQKAPDAIMTIMKQFSNKAINQSISNIKKRGVSSQSILSVMLLLPFIGVCSVFSLFKSGYASLSEGEKDSIYRMKNRSDINWRGLLYLICKRFKKIVGNNTQQDNTSSDGYRCLIVDDTLLLKTGKFIEGASRMFDHVFKRYVLGFKLLVLGYYDGKSFIPLDFSLHREKGKNQKKPYGLKKQELRNQYSKQRDKSQPGFKRKKELDTTKLSQAISMIKRALKHGFKVDYVLCDSWFCCEALIKAIRTGKESCVHLLSACKMAPAKYDYQGQLYTGGQLRKHLKSQIKRCRKLRTHYITCTASYKGTELRLFFVRYRGQGNWQMLLTTDLSLNFIKAMEIYSVRWGIEVFFKESKQYLNLGKCQSNDFDAQVADITISMIQYTMLSLCKRLWEYETIGGLFREQQALIAEMYLAKRLWALLIEIQHHIAELFGIETFELIERLINETKVENKILNLLYYCRQELGCANNAA